MDSVNRKKTNLRKLSFLGFGSGSKSKIDKNVGGSSQDPQEVYLDEECAKVFAMDTDDDKFDLDCIHDPDKITEPMNYGENEYSLHRKKSYPHIHIPLKPNKSGRKRTLSSRSDTPTHSSATADGGGTTTSGTPPMVGGISAPNSPPDDGRVLSSTTNTGIGTETGSVRTVLVGRESVVTLLLNQELDEDQDTFSSGSECILSDPSGYKSPERICRATFNIESSPDRKVQFRDANCEDIPEDGPSTDQDAEGFKGQGEQNKTKRSRSQHQAIKNRKFSLPDDPNRKRHHHHHRHRHDSSEKVDAPLMVSAPTSERYYNRRISTQPEDLPLRDNDRDQLDSHRSDDQRGLRRHKTSRPSNASMVHIARKDGSENNILSGSMIKKMYDHSPHAIFVELDEIFGTSEGREWKETARWIKYEEDVEEGVDRWGKPHVASLSFHSLLNLRKCLEDGLVILDMEERDLPGIAYRISEDLYKEDLIREEDKATIMRILLLRHRHVNEHTERSFRFPRKHSYSSLQNLHDPEKRKTSYPGDFNNSLKNGGSHYLDPEAKLVHEGKDGAIIVDIKEELYSNSNEDLKKPSNETILKRIPLGAQGSSVLVGTVDFLEQPAMAFIRLAEGVHIPSLIEVRIPVRFIFLLLGPAKANLDYHEVGRSISTLMANQQFHNIAYSADNRKALLSAINEFLDDSIVLPPGDWERQALLPIDEIKAKSERIRKRKENALKDRDLDYPSLKSSSALQPLLVGSDGKKPPDYPNPLERTKRPFGGLFNDLRRRYPHFKSDITDGINAQCAAAAIFMYFAALSGAITFGGLMSDKTENYIGISETLVATSVTGVIFAILSGQPLVIIGATGPLLLFDESLYQFCKANEIDYLVIRVYIGIWLGIIALIVAICEGSVLVKLFSRFTEEIFSALISLIYIVESFMKLIYVFGRHPIMGTYCTEGALEAAHLLLGHNNNDTDFNNTGMNQNEAYNITDITYSSKQMTTLYPTHDEFGKPINQPNTALFCTILALGTFAIAYYLRLFRNSQFLGRSARRALGDFGVPIAIVIMVFLDYMVPDTYTEKLSVPEGLSPSNPAVRGWFINPAEPTKPFPLWIIFACCIPALLVYILLFMETHICELIMDKKERKLKKGSGFHLDIVLVCLMNVGCGFVGFPWVCAATVRSVAHISAVTVMSRTHAPGEKPHIIEVKEQRVSSLVVSILVGVSVIMAPLLRLVPMSVLFGVFLYMGVSSTDGIQFFDRLKLFFMPVKHHPQTNYVRKVKTIKMHLFTFLQLMCLVILWVVKSTKASLAFPFFLILMVPLRNQLRYIFSPIELRALDGDQPDVDNDEPDFYAEALLPG